MVGCQLSDVLPLVWWCMLSAAASHPPEDALAVLVRIDLQDLTRVAWVRDDDEVLGAKAESRQAAAAAGMTAW
jgi:hypothetical protein